MTKVLKTEENLKKCLCPTCPSYNTCAKDKSEMLFCSPEVGKSSCPFEKMGCICGACPVHMENNLKSFYYCMTASADRIEE